MKFAILNFTAIRSLLLILAFFTLFDARAEEPKNPIKIFYVSASEIKLPIVEVISQIEVGESITSKILSERKPAVKFKNIPRGVVKILFFSYDVTFSSSTVPLYGKVSNGSIYARRSDFIPEGGNSFSGFFVPDDPNKPSYLCAISSNIASTCSPTELKTEIDFTLTEIEEFSKDSFKTELVYTGGNNKSINLMYREFKNDFARPAFTQDLKYDISDDPIIGFKGARFEVIKAGNSGLTYKVLKHLQ